MTPTQKRFTEGPLLLLMILLSQALELSLFQKIPIFLRPIQLTPILIAYLALTRDWGLTFLLSAALSYMGAATVGYPTGVYMASQIWVALSIRLLVSIMALEGRHAFTLLVLGGNLFQKLLVRLIMGSQGQFVDVALFLGDLAKTTVTATVLAWILYPFFIKWDRFFEHERDDSSNLQTGFR
jgi:hypothetical protein